MRRPRTTTIDNAGTTPVHRRSATRLAAAGLAGLAATGAVTAIAPGAQTAQAATTATGTILVDAQAAPPPVARPDNFFVNSATGQLQGSVLANDTDPMGQQLSAVAVGSTDTPGGFVSFLRDGSFFYFPDPGFTGLDSFPYRAIAADSRTSDVATVTFQVAPNVTPTIGVHPVGAVPGSGTAGTFEVGVFDTSTLPADLTVKVASSNTALVPVRNVLVGAPSGPTGSNRSVRITPAAGRTGAASVTITVVDQFGASASVPIRIQVGGPSGDLLRATSGANLLLGRGGPDTLAGGTGVDLLGGGGGNDTLTGGIGADVFRGGPGSNTATDVNTSEGDTAFEVG